MATQATPESDAPPAVNPIFAAAHAGAVDEVEAALASDKSSRSALNDAGRSALSIAAQRGHLKVVQRLLDAGATDTTVAGWTAAHHAAFGGHAEVRHLTNTPPFHNRAPLRIPLMIALGVSPSPVQVLDALASKLGGDALSQSTRSTMSPLHLAAIKGHVACLSRLIDAAPTSLNSSLDAHGRTALMCAASGGTAEAVDELANRGADLDAISHDGKTALMWAVSSHKPATVAALARHGADPEKTAPLSEVVVPGQDRSKGESAEDMSNAKHAKDPTLRHISTYMTNWRKQREAEAAAGAARAPAPEMPPLPWVTHAKEFAIKEEAAAAAAAATAAAAADEPNIEEVVTAGAAADENDIFGDATDVTDVPVGGGEASLKVEAEVAKMAIAADADLDELD